MEKTCITHNQPYTHLCLSCSSLKCSKCKETENKAHQHIAIELINQLQTAHGLDIKHILIQPYISVLRLRLDNYFDELAIQCSNSANKIMSSIKQLIPKTNKKTFKWSEVLRWIKRENDYSLGLQWKHIANEVNHISEQMLKEIELPSCAVIAPLSTIIDLTSIYYNQSYDHLQNNYGPLAYVMKRLDLGSTEVFDKVSMHLM